VHTRRLAEILVEAGIKLQDLGGYVEPLHHRLERIVTIDGGGFAVHRRVVNVEIERHGMKEVKYNSAGRRGTKEFRFDAEKLSGLK
jgi:hypothetical protein